MARSNSFVASFGHAFRGIFVAARGRNFRVMLLVAAAVLLLGAAYDVSRGAWALLLLCIGGVLFSEAVNTAVERLADRVEPEEDPLIRDVKDVAAGAVLLLSVLSAAVGVVVFWPYVVG